MMQNALNESFWDGLGVEIGPCANFKRKLGIRNCFPVPGKNTEPRKILGLDALGIAWIRKLLTKAFGKVRASRLRQDNF